MRDLFFLLVPHGSDAAGIDGASDGLLQFKTDPWGMASAGLKAGLERALPGVGATSSRPRSPRHPRGLSWNAGGPL